MNKQEFFAMSLPYGLETMFNDTIVTLTFTNIWSAIKKDNVLPIIRADSDLVKEITQKDCNEGKPFVPIVELAKMAIGDYDWYIDNNQCVGNDSGFGVEFEFNGREFKYNDSSRNIYHFELFQQLLKWHFWIDKPEDEEVVYATNEFNPYK